MLDELERDAVAKHLQKMGLSLDSTGIRLLPSNMMTIITYREDSEDPRVCGLQIRDHGNIIYHPCLNQSEAVENNFSLPRRSASSIESDTHFFQLHCYPRHEQCLPF
jgi:hypothetical protein